MNTVKKQSRNKIQETVICGFYDYNTSGNVTSVENLSAMQSYATYDAYNNMLTYRQPNRPSSVKYTLAYGSTAAEQKKHLLLQSTSPLNIKGVNTYDSKGNPLTRQTQNTTGTTFVKNTARRIRRTRTTSPHRPTRAARWLPAIST